MEKKTSQKTDGRSRLSAVSNESKKQRFSPAPRTKFIDEPYCVLTPLEMKQIYIRIRFTFDRDQQQDT